MLTPATLIEKRNQYYCSECMMRQNFLLEPYCDYCGAPFCNWEEVATRLYLLAQSDIYENKNKLG